MKFLIRKQWLRALMLCICSGAISSNAFAAGPTVPSELNNFLAIMLLVVAGVLLLCIGMLASVLMGAADFYLERWKAKEKISSSAVKTLMIIASTVFTSAAFAQDEAVKVTKQVAGTAFGGLSKSSFYALTGVIAVEVIILLAMLLFLKQLLAKDKPIVVVEHAETKVPFYKLWWKKLNNWRPAHEEAKLTLDHNYDGIRELDNNLPPWWLYGFYACIVFSFIYIYRFHVSHSAPSSLQEYEMAMAQAEVEKQAYLKSAANNVDENTVVLSTDANALGEGKKLYTSSCAPCHGAEGQGTVGPNLTDDYWLHNGSIKDVFKTIKYGVPEKGMKSWKDDFSPVQIAAIANYIKSIHGTKPANSKEPQGDLFKEKSVASDSANTDGQVIAQK
jgi:cytochrome c oxidase cbb3-type subunit 3